MKQPKNSLQFYKSARNPRKTGASGVVKKISQRKWKLQRHDSQLSLVCGYFPTNDVILACSLLGLQRFHFPSDLWTCFNKRARQLYSPCLKLRKILGKIKGQAPGEINLQSKQDLICRVTKVKVATSTHSIADVILFQRIYYSLRIESFHNTKRKFILHTIKNIIFVTLSVYPCFKSFLRLSILRPVIHSYL